MSRLPRVTADQVIRVLEKIGFDFARQWGAHRIFTNPRGRRATVPYHSAVILRPKTLKSILQDAELSVEEFIRLLKKS